MPRLLPAALGLVLTSLGALVSAQAQDEEEVPSLPAPQLEEVPSPSEPEPDGEERPTQILYRIGPGMHPEWEDQATAPRDIPFVVPGDTRIPAGTLTLPQEDSTITPRTFGVSVGVGYARLLGVDNVDLVRIEQRFHARIPGADFIYLGAGASQNLASGFVMAGGGPRIGVGATFCSASWVRCEGAALVQPGVMAGDGVGVVFDLNASLEARFLFPPLFELGVAGGYSLLGGASLFHLAAIAGLAF